MKRIMPPILVFLLIVLSGTGILLLMRYGAPPPRPPRPEPPRTEPVKGTLPPLKLPDEKRNASASDSWEFEGEVAANFVSARAKFVAALLHQGWRPDKQITLEEHLSPRVLLTLQKDELELVLMLWKIDADLTGFAYRREKIVTPGVMHHE